MIILQLLASLYFSTAQPVVIKAESSSQFDYEKYLEETPSRISYIQHLDRKNKKNKRLQEKLKKAQFYFLEGSLEKAQNIFSEMSQQRWKQDWNVEEKKIIVYAMLRLAQLNKKKRKQILQKTLSFDNQLPIKEDLFPPPMVAEYKKIKNAMREKVYPLPENSKSFGKIMINGRPLKKGTSFFKASQGKKRFTFISNSYKTLSFVENPESLSKKTLKKEALATGNCQSPQIHQDFSGTQAYAFYDAHCLLPARGQIQDLLPQTAYGQNLKARSESPLEKKWKKNTWLWVGATVLGVFATYKVLEAQRQNRPQRIEVQPTNDYFTNTPTQQ